MDQLADALLRLLWEHGSPGKYDGCECLPCCTARQALRKWLDFGQRHRGVQEQAHQMVGRRLRHVNVSEDDDPSVQHVVAMPSSVLRWLRELGEPGPAWDDVEVGDE